MTRSKFLTLATLAALALVVTACVGGGSAPTSWPGLSVSGDNVYVAFNQQVHALNLANGQELWSFPAQRDTKITFYAEPAVAGDLMVVGGYNKLVYGLSVPDKGLPRWTFSDATDHIVGGPLIDGKMVFIPSADYNLYALDAGTGEKRWTFAAKQAIWATPLIDNGRLYVPSLDHHLYALDAATGKLIWDRELGGALAGTPALFDGTLIVGAFDDKLYAVNAADGAIKWSQPTEGWVWSGPLVVDGTLYFGDLEGWLYSANAATGSVKWKVRPDGQHALRATPAFADGTLFVAAQIGCEAAQYGCLYALKAADGSEVWKKEVGGQLVTAPIVANGLVIVAPYGAKDNILVAALDAATGNQKWSFAPPK